MKLPFIILLLTLTGLCYGQCEVDTKLTLEGSYQGVNMYIQNPFCDDGKTFCVTKVLVNDSLIDVENNTSAFEIKLSDLNLEIGIPVKIDVYHKSDCLPKVIYQPPPKQKVKFTDIRIDD